MRFLFLFLLMIGFVSAGCVDINSASLEELDEIVWVGPATAQKIVDARPFESVDDLTKVNGIGEGRVSEIIDEGIACVDGDVQEVDEVREVNEIEVIFKKESFLEKDIVLSSPEEIVLNEKTESELIYESKDARIVDWLPYGFALFLIFIIGILLIDKF